MFALLPLVGGLLLGRFTAFRTAVAGHVAFYLIAATVLVLSAPDHGGSHTDGVLLGLVLAPLAALTLCLGRVWRRRTAVGV